MDTSRPEQAARALRDAIGNSLGRTPQKGRSRLGPYTAEAFERLLPTLGRHGITRLADITGLDILNIPGVQAIRPLALSNAVTQGLGMTYEAAAVAAICEALETRFAESRSAELRFMATPDGIDTMFPDCRAGKRWPDARTWSIGVELSTMALFPVPEALIDTRYLWPPDPETAWAMRTTTGLAVGFDAVDAVLHGVLEVVERMTTDRARRMHGLFQRHRLDEASLPDHEASALVAHLQDQGLLVGLWVCSEPEEIPVIWCHLLEDAGERSILARPAEGFGANPDPRRAAHRALLEACLSRVGTISGARDDVTWPFYRWGPDMKRVEAHRSLLRGGPRSFSLDMLPTLCPSTPGDRLLETVRRFADGGTGPMIAVPVGEDDAIGLRCIRIVSAPSAEPAP